MLPYSTPPSGGGLYVIRLSDTHYYGGRTKAFANRWSVHYRLLRDGKHFNAHAQAVFNQHGRFEPEVLHATSDEQEQRGLEGAWLQDNVGKPGCVNLSRSADGVHVGFTHSDATREKMRNRDFRDPAYLQRLSDAQKRRHREGRGFSDETRQRIAEGNRGKKRPHTSERNKVSTGWQHTDEAKAKIAAASRKMHEENPRVVTDDTRRKIREARARQAFSEETRAKMSAGLKVSWAKRKAARGET